MRQVALQSFAIAGLHVANAHYRDGLLEAKRSLRMFSEIEDLGCDLAGYRPAAFAMIVRAMTHTGARPKALSLAREELEKYRAARDGTAQVIVLEAIMDSLVGLGGQCHDSQLEEALRHAETALAILHDLGHKVWEAQLLKKVAILHSRLERHGKAAEGMQDAQERFVELGDNVEAAIALGHYAEVRIMEDDYQQGLQALRQQQELFRSMGDKMREGMAVLRICTMWCKKTKLSGDDLLRAMDAAEESLRIFQDAGDKFGEAVAHSTLAEIHLSGDVEGSEKVIDRQSALGHAKRALSMFQELKDHAREAMTWRSMAEVYMAMGLHRQGVQAALQASNVAKKADDRRLTAEMLMLYGEALRKAATDARRASNDGDDEHESPERSARADREFRKQSMLAVKALKDALATAKKAADRPLIASATVQLGEMLLLTWSLREAKSCAVEGGKLAKACSCSHVEVSALILQAQADYRSGDSQTALELCQQARTLAERYQDSEGNYRAWYLGSQVTNAINAGKATVFSEEPDVTGAGLVVERQEVEEAASSEASGAGIRRESLDRKHVRRVLSETTERVTSTELAWDAPLFENMDSLASLDFRNSLNKELHLSLSATATFDYPSQRLLLEHIMDI
eukprot:gnl/TRDRNA2_/TRDRNA2_172096_c1_seq3.p1 gnl/TRDRNA2_/TRDRNA2_172096_c1~~gnl/TRDRNA2_/TRDRNA2_172096_c1_seq3.p1  ORF type:complete len:720 (+),score=170.84 gnl/TRDRNA2_/TRDRNA2_172096_c1_seq3:279-2162(+)